MPLDAEQRIFGVLGVHDDMAKIGSTSRPVSDIQTKTLTASGSVVLSGAVNITGATTITSSLRVDGGLTTSVGATNPLAGNVSQLVYSKFKTGGTPWFQPDGANTKDIMDSFTLPANVLTTGRTLRFTVYGVHTGGNTNSCVVAITVGGTIAAYQTTLADGTDIVSQSMAVSGGKFVVHAEMYQLEASVQRCWAEVANGGTTLLAPLDTSLTQDMTTSKTFILTLKNVTAANDASIYGWTVELV
jgi:hypothetical protein